MIHVAAKWTHAFNQDRVLVQLSLQKMSGQGVRTHPPMVLSAMVHIYSIRSSASLFNGRETFWLVMMPLGGGRAIITLRAAVRDRGGTVLSEIVGGDLPSFYPFALQDMLSSGRDACECRVPLPEEVRIGERTTCPSLGSPDGVAPDSEARHVSLGGGVTFCAHWATWCAEAKKNKNIYDEPPSWDFPAACLFNNGAAERNTRSVTVTARRTSSPFCQFTLGFLLPPCTFCGLSILVCGRAKGWDGMLVMLGSVSAPLSKMSANKDTASSSAAGRVAKMRPERSCGKIRGQAERAGVLRMLLHSEWLVRSACRWRGHPPAYIHPNMVRVLMGCSILSMLFNLDLSSGASGFDEGGAKGHVLVRGVWAGLRSIRRDRFPQTVRWCFQVRQLVGYGQEGSRSRVGGKSVFDRLNKLFEITAAERHHQTLLMRETCWPLFREPQARPGTQSTSQRTGGKRQEGTLRKAPGDKRSAPSPPAGAPGKEEEGSHKGKSNKTPTPTKGVVIKSPAPRLNGWLFWLRKQPQCISRLSPPDADVAGASCAETLPPMAPPMEETGAESRVCPLDILLETIEVSCSSAQEDHPEESETEMAEENPTDPVLVPDEACTSASPFSYAELGEMLKRIPSAQMLLRLQRKSGERYSRHGSTTRSFYRPAADFDHMKAFVSQRMSGEEELRSRLEQAEASLSAARRASEESAEALKRSQMTTRLSG
ncbi:hypothetical protein CK203_006667 [Vitis vinifera]|uniref:Uncharacterized protein n=1 Tax=Vitis vinifera TaxID=29760 RepID=A0A438KBB3_VITVI|nr:hypothetical protein CK203_006667 [Vitis vinifera]